MTPGEEMNLYKTDRTAWAALKWFKHGKGREAKRAVWDSLTDDQRQKLRKEIPA